jgi:four helix bundle protein
MTFQDLEVWQSAHQLRVAIYNVSEKWPAFERYSLRDQILRSSRSVGNNIAEGYGRFHFKENIQFCRIARGSLLETLDHLIVAESCHYLNTESFRFFELKINRILKQLNGYIRYLEKKRLGEA